MLELPTLRQYNRKVYVTEKGQTQIRLATADVHYFNKNKVGDGVEGYREIDNTLTWNEAKRGWEFLFHNYNPFIPEYADELITYRDLFQGKDQTIGFRPVASHVKGELVANVPGLTEQNAVVYTDAFGAGMDLIIGFTFRKMLKIVRVRDGFKPSADKTFDFELSLPELGIYTATDAKSQLTSLSFSTSKTDTKQILIGTDRGDGKEWYTRISSFRVWDSGKQGQGTGQKTAIVPVSFTLVNGKPVMRKTITKAFFDGSVGDVFTDATATYTENKDTYYGTSFTTGGNPNGTTLAVGGWGDFYYSYIEWDLTGAPSSQMVSEVLLSLKVQNVAVNNNTGTVRRVTSSWTEAGVTSSSVPTENTTTRATLTNPVTVGVGNRDEQSILSLYQEWVDGTNPNYGLKLHSTTNSNAQHNYHSSDAASSDDHPWLILTLVDLTYTRGAKPTLPTDTKDLATVYSSGEKTDVSTDDGTRVSIAGTGTLLHLFKYRHTNGTDPITITWNGQSEVAPSSKIVKLQIYNFNTPGWEDVDTDNATAANTDFDLTGTINTNPENYYDDNNYVYARVYQTI